MVQCCCSSELHAHRKQTTLCLLRGGADSVLNLPQRLRPVVNPVEIDWPHSPTGLIDNQAPDSRYPSVIHINKHGSLGATFTYASSLKIAGKYYPWIPRKLFVLMHMPERPILISQRLELRDGAGCVIGVARPALARSMKHTDVEPTGHRIRVVESYVLRHSAVRKTAAMKSDFQLVDPDRGRFRRKLKYISWQCNRSGDNALSVVIAFQQEHSNSCSVKPPDLPIKKPSE